MVKLCTTYNVIDRYAAIGRLMAFIFSHVNLKIFSILTCHYAATLVFYTMFM